jgi:O-antigen/teichoic acid export membrane protein/GT2 family glycosyltransferase
LTYSVENRLVAKQSVSVVICAYSLVRLRQLLDAIASAHAQTVSPLEIIVVVDHNPQLMDAVAREVADSVILTENKFDRGLSGARNSGIAIARGALVAFLDDDATAERVCFVRLAERCAEPGVIGAGALIEPVWAERAPFWFPPEFLWVVGCSYTGLKPGETRNLLGAAMCLRRDVFETVGGFESGLGRSAANLPFGCEETELCIRASQAMPGSRLVFDPEARARHSVSRERATWSYFLSRCYAEGLSKAYLSRLVGTGASLASERKYVANTLVKALGRGISDVFARGDLSGICRALAVMLGLVCAAFGYSLGRARAIRLGWSRRNGVGASGKEQPMRTKPGGGSPWTTALRRHLVLFSNAGFLTLGAGISSFLGFFYWWAAAKLFPQDAIGFAAGGISLMNFIGHLGEFGLGALTIREASKLKDRTSGLISVALIVSFGSSALLGALYVAFVGLSPSIGLGHLCDAIGAPLFILGCGLTGFTLVFDQSLVGFLRSGTQVARNVIFAATKLVLLVAVVFLVMKLRNEVIILGTWILGQIASIAMLAGPKLCRFILKRPNFGLLRDFGRSVIGHHGLNLASLAPGLLLPFVVATELTASANAAFYAAWTLINVAYLAPASLATVMFAVGAQSPQELAARLRVSIQASLAISMLVSAACCFGAAFFLSLFSTAYATTASASLVVLGFSVFPISIKYHYVSIKRIQNRMLSASFSVVLGCVLEVAGATLGGKVSLYGLTLGWLAGLVLEAVLLAPAVFLCAWPDASSIFARGFANKGAFSPAVIEAASSRGAREPQ